MSPRKPGEFVARSNKMFVGTTGYYKKPEATLELFQNGWIHTGDLGRMDDDGYFYFLDRKKQAIRRRGENISSFEVEAVISAHPMPCSSACVVGVPSEVGEEEVKAVVVLKTGQKVAEEELIRSASRGSPTSRSRAISPSGTESAENAERAGREVQAQGRGYHARLLGSRGLRHQAQALSWLLRPASFP